MGHLLSGSGIAPDPADRVQAIVDMNPPQDVKWVQSFLGMCNCLSRFTPNLAEIVQPLTELTHINAVWSWSSQNDQAFKSSKRVIENATTFKFLIIKPCVLQVNASYTGLGWSLSLEWQRVAFISSHWKRMFGHQSSMHQVLLVPVWQASCRSSFRPTTAWNHLQETVE